MIYFGGKTIIHHLKNVAKWCKGTKYQAKFEKAVKEFEKLNQDKKGSFLA